MKVSLFFCVVALGAAQEVADPYSIGASFTTAPGCPVFVLNVIPGSLPTGPVCEAANE
jgi:hypothetical protein